MDFFATSKVSYELAFGVGLVASVSSCLAIVGGVVLTLAANSAKSGGSWRTQALFHIGRLGGFFLLGGLIGVIGSSLHLSATTNVLLEGFVALVMLVLGISLLDLFPSVKKLQVKMPRRFTELVTSWSTLDHALAPLLFGAGTFFLPCGFTQSMQLAALSTGSFMQGALIMFFFSLGTLPVLALISFGSFSLAQQSWRGTFFKIAGVAIITLAIFSLVNILAVLGIMPSFSQKQSSTAPVATLVDGKQIIDMTAKSGYSPREVVAKAGVPTLLRITTSDTYDCSSTLVIPALSYQKSLQPSGIEEVSISAEQAHGTLHGTCGMGMYGFQIIFE